MMAQKQKDSSAVWEQLANANACIGERLWIFKVLVWGVDRVRV